MRMAEIKEMDGAGWRCDRLASMTCDLLKTKQKNVAVMRNYYLKIYHF